MLDKLTLNDFTDKISETFGFQMDDEHLVLFKLVEATHQGSGAGETDDRREPFSLIFTTASEYGLEQNTFLLQHPKLGKLDIFLVPVGEADDCMQYEAIFN